ncbi:FCD domain-containing protein [Arthrobacter sp. NPDC089319]|uniref:FadR/GntR family transcriptional regulator n=1 Tax=Arthrobacter sp. NPDC089319 TaxID=3155915 RepID=UPI00343C0F24
MLDVSDSTSDTDISAILTPVAATRAPEAIVRRVKDAIAAGELRPGQKLPPEAQLARMLGVATMTLRHALAVLKELELVESRRGRNGGTFIHPRAEQQGRRQRVSPLTAAALRDLTDWRKAVSGDAAALAAARGGEDAAARLTEAARTCETLLDNPERYRRADAELHILIAELSGSPRMVAAEMALQQEITDLVLNTTDTPKLRRIVRHTHGELVDAIINGTPESARSAMRDHAESTFNWLLSLNLFPKE